MKRLLEEPQSAPAPTWALHFHDELSSSIPQEAQTFTRGPRSGGGGLGEIRQRAKASWGRKHFSKFQTRPTYSQSLAPAPRSFLPLSVQTPTSGDSKVHWIL